MKITIPIKAILEEMMPTYQKRMLTVNGMSNDTLTQHSPEVRTSGVHENIAWKKENGIHDDPKTSNNKEESKHMAEMNNAITLINSRFKG